MHSCIHLTLVEPLRRHLYVVTASKYFLASPIVLWIGGFIWGRSPIKEVSEWFFFIPWSSILPCISSLKCFVLSSKKDQGLTFWPSYFFAYHKVSQLFLGNPEFSLASVWFSVSAYHLCLFVTGLLSMILSRPIHLRRNFIKSLFLIYKCTTHSLSLPLF